MPQNDKYLNSHGHTTIKNTQVPVIVIPLSNVRLCMYNYHGFWEFSTQLSMYLNRFNCYSICVLPKYIEALFPRCPIFPNQNPWIRGSNNLFKLNYDFLYTLFLLIYVTTLKGSYYYFFTNYKMKDQKAYVPLSFKASYKNLVGSWIHWRSLCLQPHIILTLLPVSSSSSYKLTVCHQTGIPLVNKLWIFHNILELFSM